MAGSPRKRAEITEAKQQAQSHAERLDAMRAAMIKAGLDPNQFDPSNDDTILAAVEEYTPAIASEVARLSKQGRPIEEIRTILGFTEAQERDWRARYVEFERTLVRAREAEQGFWAAQARIAVKSGDRSQFTAVANLIDKRYGSKGAEGDAEDIVRINWGSSEPETPAIAETIAAE